MSHRFDVEQEEYGCTFCAEVIELAGVVAYSDFAEDALAHAHGHGSP